MALVVFTLSALVVAYTGTRLTVVADRLADRTGLGEALIGAVALGVTTSISGSVVSIYAAHDGMANLSVGNALGGIAAQTFFLVIADAAYKKTNLEHAAASSTNIMLSVLLISLLCLPLIALGLGEFTVMGIHPVTIFLFALYLMGLKYINNQKNNPMWNPLLTSQTIKDEPDEPQGGSETKFLAFRFLVYALILLASGFVVKKSGVALAEQWGLNHMFLGTLFTATTTSLPELITTFTAVRRGAVTLAVGGIVGGNTFDVLFLAFSDIAYRDGSIYHHIDERFSAYLALTILMTAVLTLGLLRRERKAFANVGVDTLTIGVLYFFSVYIAGGAT